MLSKKKIIYIYIFWKIKTTSPNKNKTKERPFQSYSLLRGGGHHRWRIWNLARKKKHVLIFSFFFFKKKNVCLDLYYVSEKFDVALIYWKVLHRYFYTTFLSICTLFIKCKPILTSKQGMYKLKNKVESRGSFKNRVICSVWNMSFQSLVKTNTSEWMVFFVFLDSW